MYMSKKKWFIFIKKLYYFVRENSLMLFVLEFLLKY